MIWRASVGRSFDESLTGALEAGQQELSTLASLSSRVNGAYTVAGSTIADGAARGLLADFAAMRLRFVDLLADHLDEQSKVLSTFNIAFFGRTGAGKSTLLSAFGELDGAAVSPGESDWTTSVNSIPWHGCRLYDTPGINGWGGRKSRDELEATARKAVEIADVVLLCFDTQSQQASEFTKVADWVTHFGKPVIAVLNVRNPRWRHPARVPSQVARRNMSEPVAQHAENVRTELANIGLHDVPVVAISSRRALFARAATPYRGPQEQNFVDDRDRYGVDYLARWSNFPALESVLTACIAAGGAQLRLKSLREGVRALLQDEATALKQLRERLIARTDELDRLVRRYLEVLGYLEGDERTRYLHDEGRNSDLLTQTEIAREAPYRAPADGALLRYVRNLLKPHLAAPRNNTLLRFKNLEIKAFREKKSIDAKDFAGLVFQEGEIAGALEHVRVDAGGFLERELSLAGVELRTHAAEYGRAGLDGEAGDTAGFFADILRGGGLAGGAAAAAIAIMAANPVGIAIGIGLGAAAAGLQWLGGDMSRSAAREKAEARAKAARLGRKAIHDTFDAIERDFANGAHAAAWTAASVVLRPVLVEFINLRALHSDIDSLLENLRSEASAIKQTEPLHLLDLTARLTVESRSGSECSRPEELLLGENWFDHDVLHESVSGAEDLANICQQRHDRDAAALCRAVEDSFKQPDAARISDWQQKATQAAESDEAFQVVATAVATCPRPTVVVAGDYSSGKSSFIKRMIAEFGGEPPDSLHVRADATTDEVRRYPLGPVEIIDTPGFQSRRAGHDELALAGARGAALVIVLFHVNLLIGDTTALQTIANGSLTEAGKWPRMLFVINRCDELGVDPLDSTEEFFNRRDRKCAELAAALQSREIPVSPSHIHGVAADPFGAVGAHLPVTAADYEANRVWDGTAALVDALRAWADGGLAHASALVAFDDAYTELLSLRERARIGIATYRAEAGKHDALIASMNICLEDASYLRQSLEHELADTLARPVAQAIGRIRAVDVGKDQELAEALHSWRNPDTQSELERFMGTATAKVNDWSNTHLSAISREEAAAGFDASLDLPSAESVGGATDTIGRAAGAAGFAADLGAQLGKLLGNREAALQIGHFFGHKFRPWGAIKAGKAVGRAGAVLGVVAVAADAVTWANEASKTRDWDSKREAAVERAESDSREFIKKMLVEPEGPWNYLATRANQVRDLRDQYDDRQLTAQAESERLEQRLSVANGLVDAAEQLRKVTVDD